MSANPYFSVKAENSLGAIDAIYSILNGCIDQMALLITNNDLVSDDAVLLLMQMNLETAQSLLDDIKPK